MRFTTRHKAKIVTQFLEGKDIQNDMEVYNISYDELNEWVRHHETMGFNGLKNRYFGDVRRMEAGA